MSLGPTRAGGLALLAVAGGVLGWSAVRIVAVLTGRVMGVPWLASLTLWALAIGLLLWALGARRQPATARNPRVAALAMAASRTAALVGGGYLGIAVGLLGDVGTPSGGAALAAAATALVACLVILGVSWWLESMCRIRHDDRGGPPR